MLVAKNQHGQLVLASMTNQEHQYFCPECGALLTLRQGKRVSHFAHRPNSGCRFSTGESETHLYGKETLRRWAQRHGWTPQLEVALPAINQRADLLVVINNQPVALEFQCSPLSAKRLAERTKGYHQLGIMVRWILGPTYERRQLHREIKARFTQLVNGQPCITFWEPRTSRFRYVHPYYCDKGGGPQWWARVRGETQNLQRYASLKDGLVRQAYQADHQLAACPLVAHGRGEWWPLTVEQPLRWRIRLLLALEQEQIGKRWAPLQWQAWLATKTKWLALPALDPLQQQNLRSYQLNELTNDLLQEGIIKTQAGSYVYQARARWFDNYEQKLNYLHKKGMTLKENLQCHSNH
ncbi:competence protein CoiA [Limosilactobacillus gorillae]|uniref:competence protein CoiA n=1 Tax=Limosilactobacillus gorillae TaxID=1450649 RepID=UPI000A7C6A2F|nr:competence protein CoiA family protein [Limosilactobacillus gorillae]